MNEIQNKKVQEIDDEILHIKTRINKSSIEKILIFDKYLSAQNMKQQFTKRWKSINDHISDLNMLIDKLSEVRNIQKIKEKNLKNDIKAAMRYCEMMKHNVMKPLEPQKFNTNQERQYRVIINLYFNHNESVQKNNEQFDFYLKSISQLSSYNQKLQQNMSMILKYRQQYGSIEPLKASVKFLKQQNEYLKKQNSILNERSQNYLNLKKLCDSQQNFIKSLTIQIQKKSQQMIELMNQNRGLNDKLFYYKDEDRVSQQKFNSIKQNFTKYFESKKSNYQSFNHNQQSIIGQLNSLK